jgi:hypothetical protein
MGSAAWGFLFASTSLALLSRFFSRPCPSVRHRAGAIASLRVDRGAPPIEAPAARRRRLAPPGDLANLPARRRRTTSCRSCSRSCSRWQWAARRTHGRPCCRSRPDRQAMLSSSPGSWGSPVAVLPGVRARDIGFSLDPGLVRDHDVRDRCSRSGLARSRILGRVGTAPAHAEWPASWRSRLVPPSRPCRRSSRERNRLGLSDRVVGFGIRSRSTCAERLVSSPGETLFLA